MENTMILGSIIAVAGLVPLMLVGLHFVQKNSEEPSNKKAEGIMNAHLALAFPFFLLFIVGMLAVLFAPFIK